MWHIPDSNYAIVKVLFKPDVNLERDPQEMQNLVGIPEYADIRAELRERVLSDWRIPGLDKR